MLEKGMRAPDFLLESDKGEMVKLSSFNGKKVLLYFYPRDNTPGCSIEAKNFNDSLVQIAKKGVVVLGVSKDSIKSHCEFRDKFSLEFDLLSDPNNEVIDAYGAWVLKKNYGKEYMGILRSTFLIDDEGNIEKTWYKVKAKDHIVEVKEYLGIEE